MQPLQSVRLAGCLLHYICQVDVVKNHVEHKPTIGQLMPFDLDVERCYPVSGSQTLEMWVEIVMIAVHSAAAAAAGLCGWGGGSHSRADCENSTNHFPGSETEFRASTEAPQRACLHSLCRTDGVASPPLSAASSACQLPRPAKVSTSFAMLFASPLLRM